MGYRVDPNAKNVWVRDNADTMDLSMQTDANSVYFNNGRTMEQEFGKGAMVSNVATVESGMDSVVEGTYDGAYESCQMYGKSLVNVMTKEIDTTWNLNLTNWSIVSTNPSDFILKPNTTYSVIVYVTEKTCSDRDDLFWVGDVDGNKNKITHDIVRKNVSLGTNVFVINTVSDFSNLSSTKGGIGFQGSKFVEGTLKWKAIVLEGNWTDKELPPYFTGLRDVKAPILKNVGKNILPKEIGKWYSCYFKKGTTFQLTTKDNKPSKGGNIVFVDGSGAKMWMGIDSGTTKKTYTLPNDVYKISNQLTSGVEYQLEININATPYEDYKTNILETSNDLVLRGLPSGIRDTYDCLTGEYIRRVGERDYQESDESDSNVITDLVKTHYELAEPIVTQIEPPTTPFAYENGHIILESGHEGQSLLPALEYQTVVSRSGQVAMIDKTIQQHERKITLLEKMLVQNIIDIEYKNTLLALKLEINEVI